MEQIICPVCSSDSFKDFLACIDYTVSRETFQLVECTGCGLVYTNPRPTENEMGRYYESEDYVSHSNTHEGLINKIYHQVKKAIKNKIALLNSLHPKNKVLLDIGCGTGSFIGECKKQGWSVLGVEPNEKARKAAIADYNIQVIEQDNLLKDKNTFSIITMWHVLEHVHQLKKRIAEIYDLLIPEGYVLIAVPNYTSYDSQFYKNYWAAYDVPRHLYHFAPQVIKSLFEKSNLKHIKSIPMKMDSFYVSMLSEKYKMSSLQLAKAFIQGLKSNFKAGNDAEKYSSVIYIFQK